MSYQDYSTSSLALAQLLNDTLTINNNKIQVSADANSRVSTLEVLKKTRNH